MGKSEMAGGNIYRVKSLKIKFGVVMTSTQCTHIHNELTVVPL